MIITIHGTIGVPKYIIDAYCRKLSFSIDYENTYVRPRGVDKDKLKVSPLPFYLKENAIGQRGLLVTWDLQDKDYHGFCPSLLDVLVMPRGRTTRKQVVTKE